jgi:hypothetical protein
MGYRDYKAPGVSVIVQRQAGIETPQLTRFLPVFVGTGMTSLSRDISYLNAVADTTDFPIIKFTFNVTGLVDSQLFGISAFALKTLTINKQLVTPSGPTEVILANPADYTISSPISNVRDDGQAEFSVSIIKTGIVEADLSYDFVITVTNTEDDFDLRLMEAADVYFASEIVGPFSLLEGGVTIRNDIAIATEIAFRMNVSSFYYLEVPRAYGVAASATDISAALEKIYHKTDAYRIIPLTDATAVATDLKALVTSISNPIDQRETIGFVTFPNASIADITDIDELVTDVGGFSVSLNTPRITNVFGCSSVDLVLGDVTTNLPAYFLTAAVASLDSAVGIAEPLSLREINIFVRMYGPRFRPAQWNKLATKGVFIVYQKDIGLPMVVRHQLTTSQSVKAEDQELSLVKNIDAVSIRLRERLYPYAGKYNIIEGYIEKIDGALTSAITEVIDLGLARSITILSPWQARIVPENGNQAENRNLVTRLQLGPAYPANNLDIYLLV